MQQAEAVAAASPPDLTDDDVTLAEGNDGAAEQDGQMLVTFLVDGELFSFPMSAVKEIIRVPEVVRVPLTPPSLAGLANLRGTVLPVVKMRSSFGMEEVAHTDATRVIVADCGSLVGFVVDRVARVMQVEDARVEGVDQVQSTIDSDLLTGVVKGAEKEQMILMLDPARLVSMDFSHLSRRRGEAVGSTLATQVEDEDQEAEQECQLVSFTAAGQEFAFPIDRVEEIVRVPERFSHVPKVASHVLGIMNLRNRLLPLVNLRAMFRLPERAVDEQCRIVVISLDAGDGRHGRASVGLVMDKVREVLRVPKRQVEAVPALIAADEGMDELDGICRLEEGRRLVSILSVERMFEHQSVREAMQMRDEAVDELGDVEEDDVGVGEEREDDGQLVVFSLAEQEYGALIDSVKEIIRVPKELMKVPKAPGFIEGVINLRGSVLPVVDLRRRFGLAGLDRNERQRILVLSLHGVNTGFIVDSVQEVLKLDRRAIEPAPHLSDEQSRIIGEVLNLQREKRMVMLLTAAELMDDQELEALAKAG